MTSRGVTPVLLPAHWTPEQALAVFECLQALRAFLGECRTRFYEVR